MIIKTLINKRVTKKYILNEQEINEMFREKLKIPKDADLSLEAYLDAEYRLVVTASQTVIDEESGVTL